MSINNAIYYNGVWLDIVKLNNHLMEPQYSGQNYVHTKHTLSITAIVSNEAERRYIRNKRISMSEMAIPETRMELASYIPTKFELNDRRVVGDSTAGNFVRTYSPNGEIFDDNNLDIHRPTMDIQAVRHHLLQPRGVLVYYLNNQLVLGCPQFPHTNLPTDQINAGRSIDARNGPIPRACNVKKLADNILSVEFVIECYINEAMGLQQLGKKLYVSAHSYFVDVNVDTYGMEVREVSGVVDFRSDLLKADNLIPDDFREFFAPPIPFGFKREMYSIKADPNGCRMQYRVVDREVHYVVDRSTRFSDMWVKEAVGLDGGEKVKTFIDRSKITRMQITQSRDTTVAGAANPSVFIGSLINLPDIVEHLSIRIFGNNLASRYELERAAYYVMLMRVPYVVTCRSFKHRMVHDLVGQYVELFVTRATPAVIDSFTKIANHWTITPSILEADPVTKRAASTIPGADRGVYYPVYLNSMVSGGDSIRGVTHSAANETEYEKTKNPNVFVFNVAFGNELLNKVTDSPLGVNSINKPRYLNEYNYAYMMNTPVLMANGTRSMGTGGSVAVVHTSAIMDPADPINQPGASPDMAHIKRINTDWRHRDSVLPASLTVSIANNGKSGIRDSVDQYGVPQDYLGNPLIVPAYWAKPDAPESYFYQYNA